MKTGDKFKKIYPFKLISAGEDDFWLAGCHVSTEDGAEIMDGYFEQCDTYFCDGEGTIEYEILAVVDMPRKYQQRVLYRISMVDPDGKEKKSSKAHIATFSKFKKWIDSESSSYPYSYEVE